MKIYYVYILECSDKSFYTGVTNNLERRVAEHNSDNNDNCYCFSRRPTKLVFNQDFTDINQAIAREKQIKGWSRLKKQALIDGDWEKLKELSKIKKESGSTGSP